MRGLTPASAARLGPALGDLGIAVAEGLPVVTGPLAGIDPGEIADPRPLAARAARAGGRSGAAAEGLGGGRRRRGAASRRVPADLRLVAVAATAGCSRPAGRRRAGDRGSRRGRRGGGGARAACGRLPRAARAVATCWRSSRPRRAAAGAGVGAIRSGGSGQPAGSGLPFGQADAAMLAGLAAAAATARFRPAPGRALVVVGAEPTTPRWSPRRAGSGSSSTPDDPRRAIVACSGAPACGVGAAADPGAGRRRSRGPGWRPPAGRCTSRAARKRCAQPAGRGGDAGRHARTAGS